MHPPLAPVELPTVTPVLAQGRLRLRLPHPDDRAARQRIGIHAEFRRMVGADDQTSGPMSAEAADGWYQSLAAAPCAWVIDVEGQCIGAARLHMFDLSNRRARYAVGIFDPAYWGQGWGTAATTLVLRYAFETLRLHRVDLRVLAYNARAIRAYEKAGFVQEGIEREGALINGRWESDVWMSILEQEYAARDRGSG
ncbi:MAG: GNAT family N-acetyltransferase [Caldilineaceae bacterium]|nr:GNAT family N-acetyltransferase [Caldilineaceae bacterium]